MRQVDPQERFPGEGRSGDATDKLSVYADLVATDNRLVPFSIPFNGKFQPPRFRVAQYVAVLQQGYVARRQHDRHVRAPPREIGQLPMLQVQLEAEPHRTRKIVAVDELAEPAEVDLIAAETGLARIDVAVAQDLVRVAERVKHGALAGAVAAEQEGDGPELDADRPADPP